MPFGCKTMEQAHYLSKLRAVKRQVFAWLETRGYDLPSIGKEKDRVRFFILLVDPDPKRHLSIGVNKRITELFNDPEFLEIGKKSNLFYQTREWISLRKKAFMHYGKTCMKCGSREFIHVDHIKPRSLYPHLELELNNLQILCRTCNCTKSNHNTTDYRPLRKQQAGLVREP